MRIGIVGAGFAGLATAKVLPQAGHDVVVWDRTPDVGGVWSATRRYPGVTTQSPSGEVLALGLPDAQGFPEWPTGEQVQQYLVDYATHFGPRPAPPAEHRGTSPPARPTAAGRSRPGTVQDATIATEQVDRLVVANGVFCEPAVPAVPGHRGVHRRRRAGACRNRVPRRRAGPRQGRRGRRLRQDGLRRRRPDQRGLSQHRTSSRGSCCGRCRARSPASSTSRCCC